MTSSTLAIIGTGMIACSFAGALRKNQPKAFKTILGFSAGSSCQKAKKLGYIDETASINRIFTQADIIVFGTPLSATQTLIQHSPKPQPHQLIMDVGSVKQSLIDRAKNTWGESACCFVPCHPIAGLEKTGPEHADKTLFEHKRVIITPDKITCPDKIKQALELWQSCQAQVHFMPADQHDEILSKSSHLPHLLAFSLVAGQFQRDGKSCFEWSAGGLRDFTRIAGSDPTMWTDVCLNNPKYITQALSDYIADLNHLKALIEQGSEENIKQLLTQSKQARDNYYQPSKQ